MVPYLQAVEEWVCLTDGANEVVGGSGNGDMSKKADPLLYHPALQEKYATLRWLVSKIKEEKLANVEDKWSVPREMYGTQRHYTVISCISCILLSKHYFHPPPHHILAHPSATTSFQVSELSIIQYTEFRDTVITVKDNPLSYS